MEKNSLSKHGAVFYIAPFLSFLKPVFTNLI